MPLRKAGTPSATLLRRTGHSDFVIVQSLLNVDLSCADYDRLNLDRDDPVAVLGAEFRRGLDGLSEAETRARLVKIERLITEWAKGRKLYGHLYDDLLKLKYLHQRYTNYLRWLKT